MSTMSNHLGYVPPDSFKNIEYLFHSDTLHSFGIYASGFVQKYRIFILKNSSNFYFTFKNKISSNLYE